MTHHYKDCGFDNVHLHSGFTVHETDYGAGTSIDKADELHAAIAFRLVTSMNRLSGQGVRYLRHYLGISQKQLADKVGTQRVTVARWEAKPHTPVPRPADRVFRLCVAHHVFDVDCVSYVVDVMDDMVEQPIDRMDFALNAPVDEGVVVEDQKWSAYG